MFTWSTEWRGRRSQASELRGCELLFTKTPENTGSKTETWQTKTSLNNSVTCSGDKTHGWRFVTTWEKLLLSESDFTVTLQTPAPDMKLETCFASHHLICTCFFNLTALWQSHDDVWGRRHCKRRWGRTGKTPPALTWECSRIVQRRLALLLTMSSHQINSLNTARRLLMCYTLVCRFFMCNLKLMQSWKVHLLKCCM